MSTLLVVDDMAVFREPIAASLRSKGYDTLCAENGKVALEMLRNQKPDLILLDVAMPVMDGLQFLEAVQKDPLLTLPPVILLTAVAEQGYVVRAAKLGVRNYLLKSQFSLEELSARVAKCLVEQEAAPSGASATPPQAPGGAGPDAASGHGPPPAASRTREDRAAALQALEPLMTRAEALERLKDFGELNAFSPTVAKILKLTQNERGSIEEIARALRQDHAVAIKVLKLANSSIYMRGESVETIEKATVRIGLAPIRQMMLNMSVVSHFSTVTIGRHLVAGQFWEHAIACGITAAEIAHVRGTEDPDSFFTMGLVHDVGRLVLARQLPEEYPKVLDAAEALQLPLEQVESRMLGLNHAYGVDQLLHEWKFPKRLIDPVVLHHRPLAERPKRAAECQEELSTLVLADRLSHALGLGSSGNETIYPTEELCRTLSIDASVLDRIDEAVTDQTENLKFSLLAESNEADWVECRQRYRQAVGDRVRSLYVSMAPEIDAYRIFIDLLDDDAEGPPNVGIVHVAQPRERMHLSRAFADAEAEVGVRVPALIVLSPGGDVHLDDAVMAGRDCQLLATPVTAGCLVEVIARAVDAEAPGRASPHAA